MPSPDMSRVRALPIEDDASPLVAASLAPELILCRPRYFQESLPGSVAECFVRAAVWERLYDAAARLPPGYRFVVFDAWRSDALQRWLFEQCRRENGERQAEKFVARPMETLDRPPFHLTGGAVDLSVADPRGRLLDMGTDFDATVEASATRYYETCDPGDANTATIRDNRRLLYHTMINAGFVNYAAEWWHFAYGEQLWAWVHSKHHAVFGATAPSFRWQSVC